MSNGNIKYPMRTSFFAVNLTLRLLRVTIADVDIESSGEATGGQGRGIVCSLDSEKFAKTRENQEKSRKRGKIGKKRQTPGTFCHFAPPER